LLDLAMPVMSGIEVARRVQLKYSGIPILFVTGYVDKTALGDISDDRIVRKPFVGDELIEKICAAIGRSSRRPQEKVVRLRP
jgi:DNA-binding response OmpR family regulator